MPDTEHLDPQHEEDLARVVVLIAACHHSRNEPFGIFEPCLCASQTDREKEANNNQQAEDLSDQTVKQKHSKLKKTKAPEPVYLW